jgi:hypothetical protein
MKKVSLLMLLVLVASTLLMAAVPTKMMVLTIINKSEFDVYMKLEGSDVTQAFYYLTVPAGTRDEPVVKVFTVMSDLYTRTTWQCNGVQSKGNLVVDGNIRLTFTPCGEFTCQRTKYHFEWWGCGRQPASGLAVEARNLWLIGKTVRKAGEPRMEKVTYFKYLTYARPNWANADLYNGYWHNGCVTWYWRSRTYRLPYGCSYRYQY